jgi:hypothetical protein
MFVNFGVDAENTKCWYYEFITKNKWCHLVYHAPLLFSLWTSWRWLLSWKVVIDLLSEYRAYMYNHQNPAPIINELHWKWGRPTSYETGNFSDRYKNSYLFLFDFLLNIHVRSRAGQGKAGARFAIMDFDFPL